VVEPATSVDWSAIYVIAGAVYAIGLLFTVLGWGEWAPGPERAGPAETMVAAIIWPLIAVGALGLGLWRFGQRMKYIGRG
jgi:hypothetical protein